MLHTKGRFEKEWRRDSDDIFYRAQEKVEANNKLLAVSVQRSYELKNIYFKIQIVICI